MSRQLPMPTPLRVLMLSLGACVALGGAYHVMMPDKHHASAAEPAAGDAMRGREKFVSFGCVQCHSVGGVGGRAAPPFDADPGDDPIDPVDFASWMWESADRMVPLQQMEMGYEVVLNGEDIRDLAAFRSSPEAQAGFGMDDIPPSIQSRILGEVDLSDDGREKYRGQEWHGPNPFAQDKN